MPAEKLGEKIENMRFRFEGFDISEARILFSTPAGLRPTDGQMTLYLSEMSRTHEQHAKIQCARLSY